MPEIAEIKEIDGEVWVRVGRPGDFPSGIALWTPQEREAFKAAERNRCAEIVSEARLGERDGDLRSLIHAIRNP